MTARTSVATPVAVAAAPGVSRWAVALAGLVSLAVAGGRQSVAQAGQERDTVVLDAASVSLSGAAAADIHDRFVFAGNRNLVKDVFVGGEQVIAAGMHPRGEDIAARYQRALRSLLADS